MKTLLSHRGTRNGRATPLLVSLLGALLALTPALARAKLNVVATIPDFGSIAEQVGGDHVKVTTICRGTEDAHFVDARPSFIRLLNQADVLIEGGAELERGWLPTLVNGARNSKIQGDAPGHVMLSRDVKLLDIPTGPVDRSMGDVHPLGNPHFWGDPANGKVMGATIAAAFSRLDPANTAAYQANLRRFQEKLDRKLAEWSKLLEPFRGTRVVTYHKSFDYFLARFGFELAGTIEPKPGLEPSPSYINSLIPRLKERGVKLVIIEPFRPRKTPEYLARAIGAKFLPLPEKVGGAEKVNDVLTLFDYNTARIAAALRETP
jgi:ABC-type Zn uptake system ZnuABC Zn-binding protein ZnuA